MCDELKCEKAPKFYAYMDVYVTEEQAIGEVKPGRSGRSRVVCSAHLAKAVRELHALAIRTPFKNVDVRPLNKFQQGDRGPWN